MFLQRDIYELTCFAWLHVVLAEKWFQELTQEHSD